MANTCKDRLEVSGPAQDLAWFKQQASGYSPFEMRAADESPNILNFHSLLPVPSELLPSRFREALGEWLSENWGCSVGALDARLAQETQTSVVYFFRTPWSPPLHLIQRLSKRWPQLHFELAYEVVHSWISGLAKAHAGILENSYTDFSMED